MEKHPDTVRSEVATVYAERVTQPAAEGCCTPARAGDAQVRKGAVVDLAGYSNDELRTLPGEAVSNSFGCGNPVARAGLKTGDVVLDLGSGAGIDLFLASRKVGPAGRVIGVDMTDEMIARAIENIRAGGFTNVEVRKGIIEELPVESGSVDWVISNCVINLSPEKPRVFAEIARVLKPRGQMLVSDIVAHDLPPELRSLPAAYASCVGGAISEEEYLAGLRAAGLVDVEVRDRLIYDAAQLAGYAASATESSCGCARQLTDRLREYARDLEGKIWSAKVYARKPA
jgi:arsenite methyltransferase